MKIASGTTDQVIYFVCVDSADYVSRETGKTSGDFTVYRARNGASAVEMTTPTISEVSASNAPGVYTLLLDEDMTIAAGNDTEEMVFHITATGVAPITRTIELYRPKITVGTTLDVNASGHVTRVTLTDTTTTNTDMITVSAISDGVWDESLSAHTVAGSTGKSLKQIKEGIVSVDGSVDDTSATSTTFISNLTASTDGYYHDKVIVFISGGLAGQARHIETYTGSTKSITVSQAFTAAPADGDEFLILATHEHSLNEIADAIWDEPQSGHTTSATFGKYLDAQVSSISGGGGSGTTVYIGYAPDRIGETDITVYQGETYTATIEPKDRKGDAVDLSSKTMYVVVENELSDKDAVVIADGDLTKTSTSVSFSVGTAVTDNLSTPYRWSMRDNTTNEVYLRGMMYVEPTATKD